jgi:hypothetical protein
LAQCVPLAVTTALPVVKALPPHFGQVSSLMQLPLVDSAALDFLAAPRAKANPGDSRYDTAAGLVVQDLEVELPARRAPGGL